MASMAKIFTSPVGAPVPRRRVLQHLAGGSLALASAGASSLSQSGNRVGLGQSAAFTGPAAQLGLQMNQCARLCFDAFNAAGGLNGQRIDLQTLDDGYDPARCKTNTEKFLAADVFAL